MVAYDARGPQFESDGQFFIHYQQYRQDKNKEKEVSCCGSFKNCRQKCLADYIPHKSKVFNSEMNLRGNKSSVAIGRCRSPKAHFIYQMKSQGV